MSRGRTYTRRLNDEKELDSMGHTPRFEDEGIYRESRRNKDCWYHRSTTRHGRSTSRSPIRTTLRRRSRTSDAGTAASTADAEKLEVLGAVQRAKALKLCLRRIWAVAASLPKKENSLPGLIPVNDTFHIPGHDRNRHEHEQCTFDFCEQSRVDFTSVAQRHEESICPVDCEYMTFPLQLLDERVKSEKPTAWRLNEPSLLEASRPYMAVSHVWSDGTGSGIWGPGKVNKCLYNFFSDIARSYQCEGCWWDTISIPLDDKARTKALGKMHLNYHNSRITLIHDLYLREWEWVDAEAACFAIVMSPWYSRGWTALELAQSHKVKILFKAKDNNDVIKDLDVDILAKVPKDHATADSIRKLRCASIDELGALLAILGARDTSKPRDVPIISGLLAGVDVSGGLTQQEIYQRILRKLGKIAHGHLFHDSATMSAPGFSWCPTNILDMPMAETDPAPLVLCENGDLEGDWRVQAIDTVKVEDLVTRGTHPLTQVALESAFTGKDRERHVLLLETNEPKATRKDLRALLVRVMKSSDKDKVCAKFVGPVHFRAPAASDKQESVEPRQVKVRIGSTDGLDELDVKVKAWKYVLEKVDRFKSADGSPLHHISQDWKALFFTEKETINSLLQRSPIPLTACSDSPLSKSQGEMAMFYHDDGASGEMTSGSRAFFYGNQGMVRCIKMSLSKNSQLDIVTEQPVMLTVGNDHEIGSDLKTDAIDLLVADALLLATEKSTKGDTDTSMQSLITLLLDIKASRELHATGRTRLHIALECRKSDVVRTLLDQESSPVNVDAKTHKTRETALHLAAKYVKLPQDLMDMLVEKSVDLNAQDETLQRTALHYAAEEGNLDMAERLLNAGADWRTPDVKEQVALHLAASKGQDKIVGLLLKTAKTPPSGSDSNEAKKPGSWPSDHTNSATEGEMNGVIETDDDNIDRNPTGVNASSSQSVTHTELCKDQGPATPDVMDKQRQTPLHLAAGAGHESTVFLLLNSGADLRAKTVERQTPLMFAAKKGHLGIVEKLLVLIKARHSQEALRNKVLEPLGASPAAPPAEFHTALLLAVVGGYGAVVDKLIENGARSCKGVAYNDGKTALHWTIKRRDENRAISLIKSQENADIDCSSKNEKQKALMMASEEGLTSVVTLLLEKRARYKPRDSNRRTALHLAARGGHEETVRKLLKFPQQDDKYSPARILNKKDSKGRTALHWAALSGSVKVTELLIEHGNPPCKYNSQDRENRTALDVAANRGHKAIVEKLLPKIESHDSKRALDLAVKAGHYTTAMSLHKSIKEATQRASQFRKILFAAAAEPEEKKVSFEGLLEYVKDPNIRNEEGPTLLMLAIENGHRELADHLLKECSISLETDLRDKEGRTALMVAAIKNDTVVMKSLLSSSADSALADKNGYTALHHAAENGCRESVTELLKSPSTGLKNIQDSKKRTALHIALEQMGLWRTPKPGASPKKQKSMDDHIELCSSLIESGMRLDIQDQSGRNALHLAVAHNLEEIAEKLLSPIMPASHERSMDKEDVEGQTPLLLAAVKGHTSLVKSMLSLDFEPNTKDRNGQTALLLTAKRGDNESVRALLGRSADTNVQDKHGRTALTQAAQQGRIAVVVSLLDHQKKHTLPSDQEKYRTKLNVKDDMGRTALILAAENGHKKIVATLVEKGANTDIVGNDGRKAWQRAVRKGHAPVVEYLLLEQPAPIQDRRAVNEALLLASRRGWVRMVEVLLRLEVDLTFQSGDDESTALHMAAMGGHAEVLKKLIARGVDFAIKDRDDRTALFRAAEQGFESIVESLLGRDEIKAELGAWMGQGSLLFAAEKGYDGIVKLLLDNGVDCNATDASGRTALVMAAANGKEAVVKRLLEKGVPWDTRDKNKRTALHHAAWGGHHHIVETLLSHKPPNEGISDHTAARTDPTAAYSSLVDNSGQSALHLAAERASIETVEKLVKKRANVNARCKDGQTVLHRAAWGGSYKVVTTLRKNGADPFIRDNHGKRPWHIAAEKGHQTIAVELIKEEVSVYDELIMGRKALIFAAEKGYTSIAHSLLHRNANAAVRDEYGRTPLHWAASRGDKRLVMLLIEDIDVFKNALDYEGHTPLCHAVLHDRRATVKILLENGLAADIPDARGQTALHHAADRGNEDIVRILVDHDAGAHVHDKDRRKAWQLAAENGHHQVVRLLLKRHSGDNLSPHKQRLEELFFKMSERDMVSMVQLLLELGVGKDTRDRFGRTAIGLAAQHGAHDVVGLLLRKGADPSIADSCGQTPLLWAAKAINAKIIGLILDRITVKPDSEKAGPTKSDPTKSDPHKSDLGEVGPTRSDLPKSDPTKSEHPKSDPTKSDPPTKPDPGPTEYGHKKRAETVNHVDAEGRTALVIAMENKHNKAVNLLLDKCKGFIDVNIQDNLKRTALHLAAEMGNNTWVQMLLARKADKSLKDSLGRTALLLAAEQGHTEVVKALLEGKEHVDEADEQGRTPLQAATDRGSRDIVADLLAAGAKAQTPDKRNRTPLLLAAEHCDKDIVEMLLKAGASQDLADEDERTPLGLAVANGNREIVEVLLNQRRHNQNAKDVDSEKLLRLALQSGNREVAWLIAKMATSKKMVEGGAENSQI